jgi:tRNA C32,U32 (ribose-2'-O)-methylase TrmJ
VFAYELAQERHTRAPAPRELAPQALLDRLHARARALLLHAGFLHENNPDRIYDDLRAIAGRAQLDRREAEILLGAVKQIEWKLQIATDGE